MTRPNRRIKPGTTFPIRLTQDEIAELYVACDDRRLFLLTCLVEHQEGTEAMATVRKRLDSVTELRDRFLVERGRAVEDEQ